MNFVHWFNHVLGADYGLPYGHFSFYDLESGSGSDLGEVALVGALATLIRHYNCEVHGCWRLGRHATAAGHKVCRKHHPDGPLTAAQVKTAHETARERLLPAARRLRHPAGDKATALGAEKIRRQMDGEDK